MSLWWESSYVADRRSGKDWVACCAGMTIQSLAGRRGSGFGIVGRWTSLLETRDQDARKMLGEANSNSLPEMLRTPKPSAMTRNMAVENVLNASKLWLTDFVPSLGKVQDGARLSMWEPIHAESSVGAGYQISKRTNVE